jgi:putative membrane protein
MDARVRAFGGGNMVVFWIAIILIVLYVVYRARTAGRPLSRFGPKTPEELLKERYARGEIGKDEFEQRLRELRK